MTKQEWKSLERTFKVFDRSTAYYCALRGESFNAEECSRNLSNYWAVVDAMYREAK